MGNYALLIQKLYLLASIPDCVDYYELSIEGESWRQILRDAAGAIADLAATWTPTSGIGAAVPALENHYEDPIDPKQSYDYSRRLLGRESADGPIQIVIYLRDSSGQASWCSDTNESLSVAFWAPLPE